MHRTLGAFVLAMVLALAACDTTTTTGLDGEFSRLTFSPGYLGDADAPEPSEVDPNDYSGYAFLPVSTNQENFDQGWAYVVLVEARVGEVDLEFVNPQEYWSCFEFRSDLEDNTVEGSHPNANILDGRWKLECRRNSSNVVTIGAAEFVDVRLVQTDFRDDAFDWTRFYVMTEETKDVCKDGSWQERGFRNQGQCIAYFQSNENSSHRR